MKQPMQPRPPAMLENVVRWLVPPASAEHVLGDLSERYRSPGQYLVDALRSLPLIIASQVRRTANIGRLGVVALTLFGLLNAQANSSWLTAALPTLLAMTVLVLRDAYRTPSPALFTATGVGPAAIDVGAVAGCLFLWQAFAALFAQQWLLPARALSVGIPFFCVVLFLFRLQLPQAASWPPAVTRALSVNELMDEVRGYEAVSLRASRIEIGAVFLLVTLCIVSLWAMPPKPLSQAFNAVTATGALFVAWFIHRYARITPVAEGLEFAQSVAAYRRTLERQLRLARTVVWWYLVPLSCGPAILVFGIAFQQANPAPLVIKSLAGFTVMWGLVLYIYQGSERKLQRRMAQLDRTAPQPP